MSYSSEEFSTETEMPITQKNCALKKRSVGGGRSSQIVARKAAKLSPKKPTSSLFRTPRKIIKPMSPKSQTLEPLQVKTDDPISKAIATWSIKKNIAKPGPMLSMSMEDYKAKVMAKWRSRHSITI